MENKNTACFVKAWKELHDGVNTRVEAVDVKLDLDKHYSESERHYHNLTHITQGLDELDLIRSYLQEPAEVEIAWWFHDSVYDSKAKDNEERSAELAFERLSESGIDSSRILRINNLILATKHNKTPAFNDEMFLVDVDLSILGRSPQEFRKYEESIREEYSWVSEEQFRIGRKTILESFVRRPVIYSTEFFRDKYEERARKNLVSSIRLLTD